VDYGAYLDTQRVAFQTEDALIQAATRQAIALVALYRAFGGGIGTDSKSRAAEPSRIARVALMTMEADAAADGLRHVETNLPADVDFAAARSTMEYGRRRSGYRPLVPFRRDHDAIHDDDQSRQRL
jgi:hypothetical protein